MVSSIRFIPKKTVKPLKEKIQELGGFYDGLGYLFSAKNEAEVRDLFAGIPGSLVVNDIGDTSFSQLRELNKVEYYRKKLNEIEMEISNLLDKSPYRLSDITVDFINKNDFIVDSKESLLELAEQRECLMEGISYTELLERKLSKSPDQSGDFCDVDSEDVFIKDALSSFGGVETGYKLDKYGTEETININLKGGTINVIAAPTSHGKTMTLINLTLTALENNEDLSVLFLSYEESRLSIFYLFLNAYISETLSKNNRKSIEHYYTSLARRKNEEIYDFFVNGGVVESKGRQVGLEAYFQEKKQEFFKKYIDSGRLKIVYADEFDSTELFGMIKRTKQNKDSLNLVCIDYMQLLRVSVTSQRLRSRQEEMKNICLEMKNMAIKTGLPILVAAQFNREVQCPEDMHATKIGEAGDIERISSLILGVWNMKFPSMKKNSDSDEQQLEEKMLFRVLKGRHIGVGHSATYRYDGNTGRIYPEREGGGNITKQDLLESLR